jgi:hypothetical protein
MVAASRLACFLANLAQDVATERIEVESVSMSTSRGRGRSTGLRERIRPGRALIT